MSAVTRRVCPRFFATREVPTRREESDGELYTQRRSFAVEAAAWRWVARGALFVKRAAECYCDKVVQPVYRGSPAWDGGPDAPKQCEYCDQNQWAPVVARLARIMMSRAKAERKI